MTQGFYAMLGLCMRAGKLATGEDACVKAIRAGTAKLAILDGSASQNTRKALSDACAYRSVPLLITEEGRFGDAIGKPGRKTGVTADEGFAKAIRKHAGEEPGTTNPTR